jgi:hypothetical protein
MSLSRFKLWTKSCLGQNIYFAGSVGASILNYLIYPITSRILSKNEVSDVLIVLTLSSQIVGVLAAINIAGFFYSKEGSPQKLKALRDLALTFFGVLFIFATVFSQTLLSTLGIHGYLHLLSLAIMLSTSIPLYVWIGEAQAKRKLGRIGLSMLSSSAIQLLFALSLSKYDSGGVLIGTAIGQIIGLAITYKALNEHLTSSTKFLNGGLQKGIQILKGERTYLVSLFFATIAMTIIQAIDIIMVKHSSLDTTGNYSYFFLVGRLVFYIGIVFMWIVIPSVDLSNITEARKIKHGFITRTYIAGCGGLFILWIIGTKLIEIAFNTTNYTISNFLLNL